MITTGCVSSVVTCLALSVDRLSTSNTTRTIDEIRSTAVMSEDKRLGLCMNETKRRTITEITVPMKEIGLFLNSGTVWTMSALSEEISRKSLRVRNSVSMIVN